MWRREGNNVRNVPRRRIMAEKKVCVLATAYVGLASWLPVSAAGISLGINPQPELARHDWGNRDGSN